MYIRNTKSVKQTRVIIFYQLGLINLNFDDIQLK